MGGKCSMTTESFIRGKHFEESDFVYHTNDTNNRRKRKLQKEKLKYRYVEKEAYPTKFQNCPSSLGWSDQERWFQAQRLEGKRLSKLEAKTVRSVDDICSFLNESHLVKLPALDCKIELSRATLYKIGSDTFSSKLFLRYILVIFDDLNIKIWNGDENMSLDTLANL